MAGLIKKIPDTSDWRADFPIMQKTMNGKPLAYLDSASSAQKPQAVIDTMTGVMETHYANVHRGLYEFSQTTTAAFEKAREKVAGFIGAQGREIVFTRNATEAINLVAASWGAAFLKSGDEIILTELEHHANIVPWQLLRGKTGVMLKTIPVKRDGTLDLDSYKALLSPRTKLVAFTHVSNVLGTINPVKQIVEMAKANNARTLTLVDGSQGVVHSAVDVRELGCDFYVFTGHKLYGPTGIGVLWGQYDVLEKMPPYQGGGDMIERVAFEETTFKEPPARFEAGTPAIVEAICLGVAIDYIEAIGRAAIAAQERELLAYAMTKLEAVDGLTFYGRAADKAGIISFTADWGHASDIGMILNQCGVAVRVGHHCCMPLMARLGVEATVRASLGLYSNEADVDALVKGLLKAKELLS